MESNGIPESMAYGAQVPMNPDLTAAEAALKARLSRKRTKTGCLTCRRRRIKCGEERPICKNCIKSKRQCEGYNPRVTFRQPSVDYAAVPTGGTNITFRHGSHPGPVSSYDQGYAHGVPAPSYYSYPHARPATQYGSEVLGAEQRHTVAEQNPVYHVAAPYPTQGSVQQYPASFGTSIAARPYAVNGTAVPLQSDYGQHASVTHSTPAHPFIQSGNYGPQQIPPIGPVPSTYHYQHDWRQPYPVQHEQPLISPVTSATADKVSPSSSVSTGTMPWSQSSAPAAYTPRPELSHPLDYQPVPTTAHYVQQHVSVANPPMVQSQPQYITGTYEEYPSLATTDTNFLSQAAVEIQDDDYYDIGSDEEMDTMALAPLDRQNQQNLHRVLQTHNINTHDLQRRHYDTFLYEGILDRYRVEDAANPLKNPATARVFAHFIAVTGPSLSAFERHSRNASVLSTEGQIPFSQQGLWTYTMPVAALRHQGLLHSMLALASLHIARLQNASDTPSRQHYAWACKRINNLLGGSSKKRHKITTIAASMLLGFYEIFTADHRAWNLHLSGSKQLFLETDFVNLTRHFRQMKREMISRAHVTNHDIPVLSYDQSHHDTLSQFHDVDEAIISRLIGRDVYYDDEGHTPHPIVPPQMDLSNFEVLRDLYWWYLKQDAYQSIISGNPLLLDYNRWANCPPRAPLGRADGVYGSFDHLVLLLGRIADFSARDRKRKLRQMEAHGDQWTRAPEMSAPAPPQEHQSQPTTPFTGASGHPGPAGYFAAPLTQAPPQPQFYGMAPLPRQNVQMPSAYNPNDQISAHKSPSPQDEVDLNTATQAALEEYGRIRAALHEFSNSLGDQFEPLGPDLQPPLETPFGKAVFYRSYDIGCLWGVYYMALIIAIRSHPHMHPAAHAAAAMASQETAFFANEIGRINAGIAIGPSDQGLNPTLGAALCESCIPAFFAAIQYRSPQQRHATVMRIHHIALRTGWGSAETIASGCETAWVKAAMAGRGPPYTRVVRPEYSDDPRLNGSWEELNPYHMPNEKDERDRRLVNVNQDARLMWAIGVMGMEDDEKSKAAA